MREIGRQHRGVEGAASDYSQPEPKFDLGCENSQTRADDPDVKRGSGACSAQEPIADISPADQQGLAGQVLKVDVIRTRERVRPGQHDVERFSPELRDIETGHSHAAGQHGKVEAAIRDSGEVRLSVSGDQLDLNIGMRIPKPGEQRIESRR